MTTRSGTELHHVFPIHVVVAGDATLQVGDDNAAITWDALCPTPS